MPEHSATAGSIILEKAYATSKMLDSSGWNGLLRHKSTPSDVDHPPVGLCFDNNGRILFSDFSITCSSWDEVGRTLKGQRWLYESLIKYAPHCAVICRHHVTPAERRYIDTLRDVDQFQAMIWDFEPVLSPIYDGAWWQSFVTIWMNESRGPLRIRRHLLGLKIGMIKPKAPTIPPEPEAS
jgi:hypothetical protein